MTDTPAPPTIPVYQDLMNPCLEVLRNHERPLTIAELNDAVAKHMRLGADVLAIFHNENKNGQQEVFYRLAWARSYLKKMGLLTNPSRGYWSITKEGRDAGTVDARELASQVASGAGVEELSASVPEPIAEEILALYPKAIRSAGHIRGDELAACYARFRAKFGPKVLRSTHGEDLLELMHGRTARDSLVYWLEFKNDSDMPAVFGSIAGGSALKFGIYQRASDGAWMTGSPMAQRELTVKEAINIAETQRDQFVLGASVLAAHEPETADYTAIEKELAEVAPDLAGSAWGHKYFSLLFPDLLDDYHNVEYQQYHLIRLYKLPSSGRYLNARLFAGIARQLEIPLTHLGTVLNARDGDPSTVWRVGTSDSDKGTSEWPRMRDGGMAAVGWGETGDLSEIEHTAAGKAEVRERIDTRYPNQASATTRAANQLFAFATRVRKGDTVVAMLGGTVLGIGEVIGDYYYSSEDGGFAHRRPVRWRSVDPWKLIKPEGLQTTFVPIKKNLINLVEIARRMSQEGASMSPRSDRPDKPTPIDKERTHATPPAPLSGLLARIQGSLHRKGQVILYGPPGTGKTYWALQAMDELAARSWFACSADALTDGQRKQLKDDGAIAKCTFHPSYGYEDFLVGYRPAVDEGNLVFKSQNGVFANVCERAIAQPERKFFLLIDEINRGDIPRIFGELITVLEKDKRETGVVVPLMAKPFVVPSNVYLLGTMNTADRSIVLLDAALRRRFAFIELMPDSSVLLGVRIKGLPLGPWFDELNRRVIAHAGRDSRNLQVGHSYLMSGGQPIEDVERFVEVLRNDIVPLLQEYCYDDFDALTQILGKTLVSASEQRVNDDIFELSRRGALFEALLLEFKEITTTDAAAAADGNPNVDEDLDGEEEPPGGDSPDHGGTSLADSRETQRD